MAISVVRTQRSTDFPRLDLNAYNFAKRHCIKLGLGGFDSAFDEIEFLCGQANDYDSDVSKREARLWEAIKCRTLGIPVSISLSHPVVLAHGVVGVGGY